MYVNFQFVNNLAEPMPPVIDHVFQCLTKMNLQRDWFFTEFEHNILTLKVQRFCMVQPYCSQEFYLTARPYEFAIAARSWKLEKEPSTAKPRALTCFLFFLCLWSSTTLLLEDHKYADMHPCKIYLAPVLFWVPTIYFYLHQHMPFPIREQTTIVYV